MQQRSTSWKIISEVSSVTKFKGIILGEIKILIMPENRDLKDK